VGRRDIPIWGWITPHYGYAGVGCADYPPDTGLRFPSLLSRLELRHLAEPCGRQDLPGGDASRISAKTTDREFGLPDTLPPVRVGNDRGIICQISTKSLCATPEVCP
jgi:hypothetical protein